MNNEDTRYIELINRLSELCGIIPEYWDIFGTRHVAEVETKKAVLNSMGFKTDTAEIIQAEINKITSAAAKRFIEPVYILPDESQSLCITVQVPFADSQPLSFDWILKSESDEKFIINKTAAHYEIILTYEFEGTNYAKASLCLFDENEKHPAPGYYKLDLSFSSGDSAPIAAATKVIIAPQKCYIPDQLKNKKQWGLVLNLYAMRTEENIGIGSLRELKNIIERSAKLGSSFVGINPLNAIPNKMPYGVSPYSPTSRLYKNFIYIDLDAIEDLRDSARYAGMKESEAFNAEVDKLNSSPLIDYEKSAALKEAALRIAFEHFYTEHYQQSTPRAADFKRYVSEQGLMLKQFATYMALAEHFYSEYPDDSLAWQNWPAEFRDPAGSHVMEFAGKNRKQILYWKYIQWILDTQMKDAALTAERCGMLLGIYHDLAVGSVSNGSDIWSYKDIFALSMDTGCPPDDFNPDGQNWGFPPMMPEKLRATGYEYFIRTLRQNMRHCGAIRIDHALGMFRRYLIPKGSHPKHGVYLHYPVEDLFRIIALESNINKTVVIAEDLGTVGENVWDTLQRYSALSFKLLYFQRQYPEPDFLSPEKYPEHAICSVTTHDLPTLFGFWAGKDIELRKKLGIIKDEEELQRAYTERVRDKRLLLKAVADSGIDVSSLSDNEITPQLCAAVYEFLSKTPCMLLGVNLDDILGTLEQQNMPGTIDEHPNWRQKTEQSIRQILDDALLAEIAERCKRSNRGHAAQ
ncbi:MAG: 4-alpha-glucanotransferase [Nitrospiraceae bacterium]|nr:4-alpha-glucanotransferase [Nitrospiraceae bacterium]